MTLNTEAGAQVADQAQPGENQAPRSPSERYMASLWTEIIGMERVMLSHKFLEVGGNSLTLNITLNRIEAEKGVALDPQLFFDDDRSSLFELAKELDAMLASKPDRPQ